MWTEFVKPSEDDWRALVARESNGKTPEQLTSTSWEGLAYPACANAQTPTTLKSLVTSLRLEHTYEVDPARTQTQIPGTASALRGPIGLGSLAALAHQRPEVKTVEVDLHTLLFQQGADVVAEVLHDARPDLVLRLTGETWRRWGVDAVHELGWTVAGWIEVLRALSRPVDARRITLQFCAGPRLLMEVSKIRAASRLWNQVSQGFGQDLPLRLEVVQDMRHFTLQDPHNNLLRSTVAATVAALTQVESVELLPPAAGPDAERWRDNVLHLLHHEARLERPGDALAGSGVVEELTEALAQAAWAEVQRLEAGGGILRHSDLQARADGQRLDWEKRLRRDTQAMVGVNRYVAATAVPKTATLESTPAKTPLSFVDALASLESGERRLADCGSLEMPAPLRWSAPFEALHRRGQGRSVPVWVTGDDTGVLKLRRDYVQQWLAVAGLVADWRSEQPQGSAWILCCEDVNWPGLLAQCQPPFLAGKLDYSGVAIYRGCDRVDALEKLLELL